MPHPNLLLAVLATLAALLPTEAAAYIDPHAGGSLFQLLAPLFGMVVAAWVTMRRYIAERLRSLWRRITGRPAE